MFFCVIFLCPLNHEKRLPLHLVTDAVHELIIALSHEAISVKRLLVDLFFFFSGNVGDSYYTALRILGMSWGVETACFKAPGVSLGGSGVFIGGVRILRVVGKKKVHKWWFNGDLPW